MKSLMLCAGIAATLPSQTVLAEDYVLPNPWHTSVEASTDMKNSRAHLPAFVSPLLSVGVPIGLAALGFAFQKPEILFAAPLGLGAGQIYAGDVMRGTLVGLGAPVAIAGGTLIALIPGLIERWREGDGYQISVPPSYYLMLIGISVGTTVSTLGYSAWAISDAYETALKANGAREDEAP